MMADFYWQAYNIESLIQACEIPTMFWRSSMCQDLCQDWSFRKKFRSAKWSSHNHNSHTLYLRSVPHDFATCGATGVFHQLCVTLMRP